MTLESWAMERLKTIAMMAAILEAGDRATVGRVRTADGPVGTPEEYVERAEALFDAADEIEGERVESEDAASEALDDNTIDDHCEWCGEYESECTCGPEEPTDAQLAQSERFGADGDSPSCRDAMNGAGRGYLLR